MTHFASRRFWARYEALPEDIRALADKSYSLLKSNPQHPSLHFKKLGKNKVTGIAEYERRERLAEIQRKCEAEPAYADIQARAQSISTSFQESILDKLEIDP